ncbi:MAG: sulfite exporter TauE/SafE family protein [Cryobacterium sp.]|nr:sulfite exporter TauE/SafE family protein [Oligoflexia bacterium]
MFTLTLAFFGIALLYSTVGFGGGSSYIALLALSSVPYAFMPKISLLCNLLVVTGGCYLAFRKKLYSARLLVPFVLTSIPMAYVGGLFPLKERLFIGLLTVSLVLSGLRILFLKERELATVRVPSVATSLAVGGALGLFSGMVGIGGGIFLSPVLINMGWARSKNAAAVASAFIFLNSLAGLAGQFTKDPVLPDFQLCLPLFFAVLLGGQIGSRIGTHSRVSYLWIQRGTGALTLLVGGKLLLQVLSS